ncbi:UvrB/UvrC motif-containing protein [Selenihalanaerobacter shriftii]|uniref:Protein-arginine kinase activator protein McsA n=1 Tax=Selenihalanaerobacter shriftii TaxID=142842 RepID=A0A1T4QCA9_9FIRM|nr:UvrB/UvrC motif-containing protein [Selenihalanaerobacter shriftii]SKA01335.1 Protein-arginine kinase activator protein McsA [Selenihalanaerobacter shriftii]
MVCQECQENKATVHVTKIVNGKKKEFYLCEECAQEKGEIAFGNESFSFNNLLAGLLNNDFGSSSNKSNFNLDYKSEDRCESCGLSYNEFSRAGKLGCNECYTEFEGRADKLLKRIHGSKKHTGKVPQRAGGVIRTKKEIKKLRQKMQDAVQKENFEEAAELRDKIKELETEIK